MFTPRPILPQAAVRHLEPRNVMKAASRIVIPVSALPGSLTDKMAQLGQTSFGMKRLALAICEQRFIFNEKYGRTTEESRAGTAIHREYMFPNLSPEKATSDRWKHQILVSSPEEEAAHLFVSVPAGIKRLLTSMHVAELRVFGHHFDRALDGSIDIIDATNRKGVYHLKLQEVKTYVGHLSLGKIKGACNQTGLYMHFLRRMLDKDAKFDFQTYFKARGLDFMKPFHRTFSDQIIEHLISGMNPNRIHPRNLEDLASLWNEWVQTLPPIEIDEEIYITTIERAGRISKTDGYGTFSKTATSGYTCSTQTALDAAQTAIDLLDGRKQPKGLTKSGRLSCIRCEFFWICPWTQDLRQNMKQPSSIPTFREKGMARTDLAAVDGVQRLEDDRQADGVEQLVLESPFEFAEQGKETEETEEDISSFVQSKPTRTRLSTITTLDRAVNVLRNLYRDQLMESYSATRTSINAATSNVRRELLAMQQEHWAELSALERHKKAKLATARRAVEKRERTQTAVKMAAIQRQTQRRALLHMVKKRREVSPDSAEGALSMGIVPYVSPAASSSDLKPYRPSFSRMRRLRHKLSVKQLIPPGGKSLPEDETYSLARMQESLRVGKDWSYQFDSRPSLGDRQRVLARKDAIQSAMKVLREEEIRTDAEIEELERKERRARRRAVACLVHEGRNTTSTSTTMLRQATSGTGARFPLSSTGLRMFHYPARPWMKSGHLRRLPIPKPLEKLRVEAGNIERATGPVQSDTRGEEHVMSLDLDYMHVTPGDVDLGLVLTGLNARTNISSVTHYIRKRFSVRQSWVYAEGTVCVRFESKDVKEEAETHFKGLQSYPFTVYDPEGRHWVAQAPDDQAPVSVHSLTPTYDTKEPEPGTVLLLRAAWGLPPSIIRSFKRYSGAKRSLRIAWTRFYAHDKWLYEYYIKFNTMAQAAGALEEYAGKKVTIPYSELTTADKVRFPYGKTVHLWIRHTGLSRLPQRGTQMTKLWEMILYGDNADLSPTLPPLSARKHVQGIALRSARPDNSSPTPPK